LQLLFSTTVYEHDMNTSNNDDATFHFISHQIPTLKHRRQHPKYQSQLAKPHHNTIDGIALETRAIISRRERYFERANQPSNGGPDIHQCEGFANAAVWSCMVRSVSEIAGTDGEDTSRTK